MLDPKCIYQKSIFAKCTRLACLLSFASLFQHHLTTFTFVHLWECFHHRISHSVVSSSNWRENPCYNWLEILWTPYTRCRMGEGMGLSEGIQTRWRSWDDWGLFQTPLNVFKKFLNVYSVSQVFPMLDILTKEFSTKGPIQISVGIRVDLSIYQVGA